MKTKHFTLVEIMIVVSIIAILAAIAVPAITQNRKTTFKQTINANIKTINSTIAICLANEPSKSRADVTSFDDIKIYLSEGANREEDFTVGSKRIIVTATEVHY